MQKTLLQWKHRCRHLVLHDIGLFRECYRHPVDAYGSSKAIHISIGMSHDKDLILTLQQLLERLCLDSRLDSCRFFRGLRLASEIRHLFLGLYNRLVAAAAECHINRGPGILVVCAIFRCPVSQSDTECYCHLIADIYLTNLIQDRKAVIQHFLKVFLLKHKEILIFLDFFDESVYRADIAVNLSIHKRGQERTPDFLHLLQNLVIVINIDQTTDDMLISQFLF